MFADDTALLTTSANPMVLQTNLKYGIIELNTFYTNWRLNLNISKCEAIFFTKKRKLTNFPDANLMVNDIPIPWSKQVKYLGIYLDTKLNYRYHILSYLIPKINQRIRWLYPFISRNSCLNSKNKITLYKVMFLSFILYASPIWGKCAKTHINKLQILQNKFLKRALNLPFYFSTDELHKRCDIRSLNCICAERLDKFQNSL